MNAIADLTLPFSVEPATRQWIIDQARAGQAPHTVLQSLCAEGWTEEDAMAAIESALRGFLAERAADTAQALPASLPQTVPVPEPLLDAAMGTLRAAGRDVRVLMMLREPRVILFGGLLAPAECAALINLARGQLKRSMTLNRDTGDDELHAARTSQGMFFQRGANALVQRVEARMASLMNWPVENGEGLQILRYGPGAEYRPHHDWFDPDAAGSSAVLKRGGQRVASLVCYLNTPLQGGSTVFPESGLDVGAVQGNALFFSYDRPHASGRTLHGGSPVLKGEKWVATKWVRERHFE